ASLDGTVKLWDLRTSRPVIFDRHTGWVELLAFRRDGRRVLSEAGVARAPEDTPMGWDPETGELDPALTGLKRDEHPEEFVRGSPWRQLTASSPGGKLAAQVVHDGGLDDHPSRGDRSRRVASNAVEIRDMSTGRVVYTLISHTAPVVC